MFYPQERLALFIDGANLYAAARNLGFDIDYRRLRDWFRGKSRLVRAYYYTVLIDDQEYSPIRPLVDWLDYNGYSLVTKPAREYTDNAGRRRFRNSIDVELTVDMMEMAGHIDHAVLFSGDGSFRRVIEAVQARGTRVTVVATVRSTPPMAADELRRQADNFVDLVQLRAEIERAREARRPVEEQDYDDDDEGEEDDDEAGAEEAEVMVKTS